MQTKTKKEKEQTYNIVSQRSFYSDLSDTEMDYAILIRSPISKGTIRDITCPNLPEGYHLITAKDIPGSNEFTANDVTVQALGFEKISYKGEPIAILTGPDETLLNDLINEVEIKYTTSIETEENQIEKHKIFASRQIFYGESEMLYLQSALQLRKSYVSELQIAKSSENIGAFCDYSKRSLKVYAPTCWPTQLIDSICNVLAIEKKSVTVIKTNYDDATTNTVFFTNQIATLVAFASKFIEKSLRLVLTHDEMKEYVENPINVHSEYQIALEGEGSIRAMNADIRIECGAFCPFAQEIVDHIIIALSGMYRFKTYCITCYAQSSERPPLSADLQLTDFLAFFSIENLMQDIAQQLHLEPNVVRLANLGQIVGKKTGSAKTKTKSTLPIIIDNSPCKTVIDKVVESSDFRRKYISYSLSSKVQNSKFPLKGIGMSCAFEGNGFYGESVNDVNISMQVTLDTDGTFKIISPKPSETIVDIWKNIVAEELNIEKNKIFIVEPIETGITNMLPETVPENISILTILLKKCCEQVKKQEFRMPLPITVKKDLANSKTRKWDQKNFKGEPFFNTSWISTVVEVEIDRNTFSHTILAIWICINAGEIYNKKTAISSVKKAVAITLKMCEPQYTHSNVPIHIEFIESKEESKEIGNLIYNALPAALTNALYVALQKDISVLPIAIDSLYYALKNDEVAANEN